MYAITGATGNIGKRVSEILLNQGKQVRVIGRDSARLQPLADLGGLTAAGSVEDTDFLRSAFDGAAAVLTMIPSDIHAPDAAAAQDRIGTAIVTALAAARVPAIVNISSMGAEVPSGMGPISGLHRQEQRLNGLQGSRILHFRPAFFMENFLQYIPMVQTMGIVGTPIRKDFPFPMIATRDVAKAAAGALLDLEFPERSVELLLGPRNYTMEETTAILGKAIGKPQLAYIQFPYEDAEKGLIGAGISVSVAQSLVEMHRALNEGRFGQYVRSPQNTTGTTFDQFAASVAGAFSG